LDAFDESILIMNKKMMRECTQSEENLRSQDDNLNENMNQYEDEDENDGDEDEDEIDIDSKMEESVSTNINNKQNEKGTDQYAMEGMILKNPNF
jgi:hypothetical protein